MICQQTRATFGFNLKFDEIALNFPLRYALWPMNFDFTQLMLTALAVFVLAHVLRYLFRKRNWTYLRTDGDRIQSLLLRMAWGWILSLDYTDRWGVMLFPDAPWHLNNLLFCGSSMLLVFMAYKSKQPIRNLLILIELVFWIVKLLVIKGEYALGFDSHPNPAILGYDFVALSLRLFVLWRLFGLKKWSIIVPIIIATGVIWIKVSVPVADLIGNVF